MIVSTQRRNIATLHHPSGDKSAGALAVVRAYCAADAPIVARIGHGGVLRVIDYLPPGQSDGIGWYGVADDESSALLGWTQTPSVVARAAATQQHPRSPCTLTKQDSSLTFIPAIVTC